MMVAGEEKKSQTYKWAFVLLVVFYSGSAYAASSNSFYALLKYTVTLGTCFYALSNNGGRIPYKTYGRSMEIWIPAVWSVLSVLLWFVHNDTESLTETISRLLHIWFVYEVICIVDWDNFKEKYVQCIVVLSVLSLVFYLFLDDTNIYNAFMPNLSGYSSSGRLYNKYQGFLIYFKSIENRNYGPFWEPGIFATHIVVTILLMPHIRKNNKRWIKYGILIVALLTTSSSAGYVLLGLALACNVLNTIKVKTSKDILKIIPLSIIVIILIYCYLNLNSIIQLLGLSDNTVYSKILSAGESQRSLSISINWNAFLKSPIIGHGFSGLKRFVTNHLMMSNELVLDTATSFRLLAAMGVSGGIYTILLVLGIVRQKHIAFYTRVLLCCIALIIINKEAHDSFMIGWCLIMYLNGKEISESAKREEKL